jgi:4-amino-4-deoxy-L-arabinose transferase-like glycosyltransferase
MTSTVQDAQTSARPTRGLAAALDYATASHARAVALLIGFAMLAFLPGFFQIPPVDRDEPRFAQATKQMLETDDYVDIHFQNEVRYKKPVGIYWLQAAAVKTGEVLGVSQARTTIWLYRLPSLFGATGAVLLTYWAALAFVTRRSALLAALMMASSVLLGVEARLAKTDAMLLLTSVAVMGAMARLYLGQRRNRGAPTGLAMPALLWTSIAAGVLLKGPVVVMFVALAALALSIADRDWKWLRALRPLPGLAWLCLLVLPWFVAIMLKSGSGFFVDAVGEDMLAKVVGSQEGHGAPPGYYALLFFVTFWPASVLAVPSMPAIWRTRGEPAVRFLLAWLLPSWIVFEMTVTKLPHYVLPLYPAIAVLIARVVEGKTLGTLRWMVHGTIGWFVFPAVMSIAAVAGFVLLERELGLVVWPFAAAALILALFAWRLYEVDGAERALLRAMLASVFIAIGVYAVTFPSIPSLFPSAVVAKEVEGAGCVNPHVASTYAYQEPSLVFLAGTDARFIDGVGAAEFLRAGSCHFALIDPRNERSFVQRANALGLHYKLLARVEGFNISIGRWVSLAIFGSASP